MPSYMVDIRVVDAMEIEVAAIEREYQNVEEQEAVSMFMAKYAEICSKWENNEGYQVMGKLVLMQEIKSLDTVFHRISGGGEGLGLN